MSQPSSLQAIVVDANTLIAVCAREQDKLAAAESAINDYAVKGCIRSAGWHLPKPVCTRLQPCEKILPDH